MARLTIWPATLDDVPAIAADIRDMDREEVSAYTGQAVEDALTDGLRRGLALTVFSPSKDPIAIFGVCPRGLITGTGVPVIIVGVHRGIGWNSGILMEQMIPPLLMVRI